MGPLKYSVFAESENKILIDESNHLTMSKKKEIAFEVFFELRDNIFLQRHRKTSRQIARPSA
jgi:hypothetical protein